MASVQVPAGSYLSFLSGEEYEWLYVTRRLLDRDALAVYPVFKEYWDNCGTKYDLVSCDACVLADEGCPYRAHSWINITRHLSTYPPWPDLLTAIVMQQVWVLDPTTGEVLDSTSSLLLFTEDPECSSTPSKATG